MKEDSKSLAIIPARGGSKRIPKKNIKDFLGEPIIQYSIEVAKDSGLFDEVMVSTDSRDIAEVSEEVGAKVPFMRSDENSDDYATLADVIEEVLDDYRDKNKRFEYFCCILPTAPFVTVDDLEKGFNLLTKNEYESVIPVKEFDYPIQRALKIENNKVQMIKEENIDTRSQDLEPTYHDAGQFYWMETEIFEKEKKLFVENTGAIIKSSLEVQDIDTEEDWKIAECKYRVIDN